MWRLLLLLVFAGCFSETEDLPGETCKDGEPGCDCTAEGTCLEGNECVASIDKCVPIDCTPGSRTCTCAEQMQCLGDLQCTGGVCLDPPPATTGDPTVASTTRDATDDTLTGPMTSSQDTETSPATVGPVDTGDTSGMSSISSTTDSPTSTDDMGSLSDPSVTASSDSGVGPVDCEDCLFASANGACNTSAQTCFGDSAAGGCSDLFYCIVDETDTVSACCDANGETPMSHLFWGIFLDCAQMQECMMMCDAYDCPL